MKYEYKILECREPTASEEQLTREFGAEGWLLATIYQWDGKWLYVFARPAFDA